MGQDGGNYDDREVRAIIDRALQGQPRDGITHDDLLAIGDGVGLSREAVERAVAEVRDHASNTAALAAVVSRRRRGVAAHAFVFVLVMAALFAINALTTPGEWWVLFPLFAWGLGLLLHAGFALGSPVSERRLERERVRLASKATRRMRVPAPVDPPRVGGRVLEHDSSREDSSSTEREPSRSARDR